MHLTEEQLSVINLDPGRKIYLTGIAGTGKTTVLEERFGSLLESGVSSESILVIVGDSGHRQRFQTVAEQTGQNAFQNLKITTFFGFACEAVMFYWPTISPKAGFHNQLRPPLVLTYDMAQTMMWQIVGPMLKDGYFADLRLRPQQIVSQLLDNMVRAAFNRLTVEDAIEKQLVSWGTDPEHRRQLKDAGHAAVQFRMRCFENSLVDTALIIDLFDRFIVQDPSLYASLIGRYQHLLVDNVEEQTPVGIEFLRKLLAPESGIETAIVAQDDGGGYKRFLSASPELAKGLDTAVDVTVRLNHNFNEADNAYQIAHRVNHFLLGSQPVGDEAQIKSSMMGHLHTRYRRQMLSQIGPAIKQIMAAENLQPADIAIVLPYMDGALRFKLTQSLNQSGIPYQINRRRESPREVPQVRAWLTWLLLANDWRDREVDSDRFGLIKPSTHDVAEALSLSIEGLDAVRARMIAEALYDQNAGFFSGQSSLTNQQIERIGAHYLEAVDILVAWLNAHGNRSDQSLSADFFFHRLFSELLSRPPFRQSPDTGLAEVCDWLIQMASRFRQAGGRVINSDSESIGLALVQGIYSGLVTANPPAVGDPPDPDGVFISTIQTYLLEERPVAVQIWLETSATGWWDLPRQPLSNGFVLDPRWSINQMWTLEDDVRIRNEQLSRIVVGLCSRCSTGVFFATSDLDRRGVRQDGPLFKAIHSFL